MDTVFLCGPALPFFIISMSRKIHKHPVELLVDTYLIRQSKSKKIRVDQQMLDKVAKFIGIALRNPCCEPAEEITFDTWQENWFVKSIQAALVNVDKRKWKASLTRAKEKIESVLLQLCCTMEVTVIFPFAAQDLMRVTFTGAEGQGIFTTGYHGGVINDSVTLTLPAKGKYNITFDTNAPILFGSVCMNESTFESSNFGSNLCRSGAAGVSVRNDVLLDSEYTLFESV